MKKSIYLLLVFTLLVNTNLRSQATALTVGAILNQIEEKANSILENAEYRLNNVIYNAANNITYSIRTFRIQYEELLEKTVDEFDALQENAFTNCKQMLIMYLII